MSQTTLGRLEGSAYYTLEIWAKTNAVATTIPVEIRRMEVSDRWVSVASGVTPNAATTWSGTQADLTANVGADWTRIIIRFKTETEAATYRFQIGDTSGTRSALADTNIYLSDASISRKVVIQGNPVDVAINLLGDPAVVDSDFPVEWLGGAAEGADLAVTMSAGSLSEVAGYTFESERDEWYQSQTVEAEFTDPVKWYSYLQEDFFRLWGFFYANAKGEIAFRGNHPHGVLETFVEWDDEVMKKVPKWQRLIGKLVNAVIVVGDFDPLKRSFPTELANVENAASITANGRREMKVKSRWLRTELDGVNLGSAMAARVLERLGRAPESLNVADLAFREADVDISESVKVTQAQLPDIVAGTRGKVEEIFEVEAVSMDGDAMTAKAKLVRTFYGRSGFITSNTHPDYIPATEVQRAHGFVSDNADQEMSNGDPGYKVV